MSVEQKLDIEQTPIRDDLLGLKPYESFGQKVTARLNTNENPYASPDYVVQEIAQAVAEAASNINRYPDDSFLELRELLADYLQFEAGVKVTPEQITAGNGSNEIMYELLQAFGGPGRSVMTFSPTYSMYPQYARDTFTEYITVQRNPETFQIDIDEAIDAMQKYGPSVLIVTNPNNPTGGLTPEEDVVKLLIAAQSVQVSGTKRDVHPVVCIDEAYIEFRSTGTSSSLELLSRFPNLLVVRTLSKAFALAGVRLGYAIGAKPLVDALRIVRAPYNLSSITQAVAKVALRNRDTLLSQVTHLRESRDDLQAWLKDQNVDIIESSSNFIQVKVPGRDPQEIHDKLLELGVMIRVVGPSGYFRITIGTDEEVTLFKTAFTKVLS